MVTLVTVHPDHYAWNIFFLSFLHFFTTVLPPYTPVIRAECPSAHSAVVSFRLIFAEIYCAAPRPLLAFFRSSMRLYAGRFQNQAPQTWQSKYGNPAGSVLDLRQTLVRRLVVPVIFLAITNGLVSRCHQNISCSPALFSWLFVLNITAIRVLLRTSYVHRLSWIRPGRKIASSCIVNTC